MSIGSLGQSIFSIPERAKPLLRQGGIEASAEKCLETYLHDLDRDLLRTHVPGEREQVLDPDEALI
jgi:hypothetical protein